MKSNNEALFYLFLFFSSYLHRRNSWWSSFDFSHNHHGSLRSKKVWYFIVFQTFYKIRQKQHLLTYTDVTFFLYRVKSPKTLPAVDNKVFDNSFKGELIENELYQSADNAIDSTGNKVNTKVNMSESSEAPNCKDQTQTEQELEQDQYSYPSKCKETNLSVEGCKDEEIDKLYSNAAQKGHQKTPNFDPDSDCQYAVVRE